MKCIFRVHQFAIEKSKFRTRWKAVTGYIFDFGEIHSRYGCAWYVAIRIWNLVNYKMSKRVRKTARTVLKLAKATWMIWLEFERWGEGCFCSGKYPGWVHSCVVKVSWSASYSTVVVAIGGDVVSWYGRWISVPEEKYMLGGYFMSCYIYCFNLEFIRVLYRKVLLVLDFLPWYF